MHTNLNTVLATVLAMLAFATNSILCRLALGQDLIDPATFTAVRLLSGMLVLLLLLELTRLPETQYRKGSWLESLMLFVYAVGFSYAYVQLDTGTGALILFGAVQLTLIFSSLILGQTLNRLEWLGLVIAFSGFIYLVLPGLSAPSLVSFCLMTIAGISWGIYTLKGRGSKQPLAQTCYNFLRTLPMVVILLLLTYNHGMVSLWGLLLAALSGGIASGLGYAIWYYALGRLNLSQAAVVQLSVPLIAAAGGIFLLQEAFSLRLLLASVMVLGGVFMVVMASRLRRS